MDWKSEWKKLAAITAVFLLFFWLPVEWPQFGAGVMESFHLAKWYVREHVLLCLVPAFFIAGAIGVFISQASVMKYLGAKANKVLAYGVAAASGTILAVCSCTVLPLFAGIWRMGAIAFSVIIGLIMHFIFRKEEMVKANAQMGVPEPEVARPFVILWGPYRRVPARPAGP